MTGDNYINENRTETFKKGEKVVMHSCMEAKLPKYNGKIWTCQTDSFLDRGRQEVVFLEGFSGYFSSEYLQRVSAQPDKPELITEKEHGNYDICKSKKQLAIKLGAVEVNDRELIKICYPKMQKMFGTEKEK